MAAGYVVAEAESVDEAEELLAGGLRPDLVLLDVRMPGRDGLELARRLAEFDRIPFLLLTAFGDREFVEQANEVGALAYPDTQDISSAVVLASSSAHATTKASSKAAA